MKLYNFSENLHRHHIFLLILYALFLTSSIPFASSEIKNTNIFDDSRSLIVFEQFGFTKGGQVAISLKDVSWKSRNQKAELNPSSMGFFLARDSAFPAIFMNDSMQSEDDQENICVLSSRYVKLLFNFNDLSMNTSTYNGSAVIDEADEYSLVFGNCQPEFEVSMYVHTEMYNLQDGAKNFLPIGQTFLPKYFLLMFLIYTCFFGVWSFICIKQRPTVDKIHLIMGALLLVKALKMICASEDKMYVSKTGNPHGWDVVFYIFGFFKGIMLFTVIVLIGTGWSFLKPYLQDREKEVLIIVIPLQVLENIAYVVINETGPATKDWWTWNQIFLLIDIICCCAVFFPITWSIRNLKEASKSDGKAARNLQKLTLFKNFYLCLVMYLYFTRVVVPSMESILDYRYEGFTYVLSEGASLAFYVFIFYHFQPIERNPYLVIDEEEELVAERILQDDDTFEL